MSRLQDTLTFHHWIMLATMVLMPIVYIPLSLNPVNNSKFLLLLVAVLLLCAAQVYTLFRKDGTTITWSGFETCVGMLLITLIVSTLLSVSHEVSLWGRETVFVMHGAIFLLYILWSWIVLQHVTNSRIWERMLVFLLVGGLISGLWFIISPLPVFSSIRAFLSDHLTSPLYNAFSIFTAIVGIVSLGFLLHRGRSLTEQAVAVATALVSIIALIQIGFTVGFIVYAVGLGLLLLLSILFAADIRKQMGIVVAALFLATLLGAVSGVPQLLNRSLPTEVSLGYTSSWAVTTSAALDSLRTFLVGSGPGTFGYTFSQFRSAGFNAPALDGTLRFAQPTASAIAVLSELGLVGGILFVILLSIGLLAGWRLVSGLRQSAFGKSGLLNGLRRKLSADHPLHMDVLIVWVAWVALSVGMFVVTFDVALWWLWWTLLALVLASVRILYPRHDAAEIALDRSASKHKILGQGISIVLLTLVVLIGVFGSFRYIGSIYAAGRTADLGRREQLLRTAIRWHDSSPTYRVVLADFYLTNALALLRTDPQNNQEQVVVLVGAAINEAREATRRDPQSIQAWEALARMYSNGRAFIGNANEWVLRSLGSAIQLEPNNAELHWRLGRTHGEIGNLATADQELRLAINLSPGDIRPYRDLSELYAQNNRINDGIALLESVRESNNPEILFRLGRLYYNRNAGQDRTEARTIWEQGLVSQPQSFDLLFSLGLYHQERREFRQARDYFRQLNEIVPDNAEVQRRLRQVGG